MKGNIANDNGDSGIQIFRYSGRSGAVTDVQSTNLLDKNNKSIRTYPCDYPLLIKH